MNRPFSFRFFIIFAVLAVALVGFMDWKMFGSSSIEPENQATMAIQALNEPVMAEIEPAAGSESGMLSEIPEPVLVLPTNGSEYFEALLDSEEAENEPLEQTGQAIIRPAAQVQPAAVSGSPKIAIIIDDVGMNIGGSEEAVALPAPLTIAILPYAERAQHFADEAKGNGQEIIIHTPMEAMNPDVDLGSLSLLTTQTDEEFRSELEKVFGSFSGYAGINNHMGSKLTQDSSAMKRLMGALKERGLFFVDSRTIAASVAAQSAQDAGVPFASRDVFLDHEDTPEFVHAALQRLERTARENGSAIAIGHPKQATLQGLKTWIPDAKARGFEFVPVSALLKRPSAQPQDLGAVMPAPAQSQPPG